MGQPSLYWYCDGVRASALCCHLQAILHAGCSTLTNLQDNGAKFRFFITNLKFSFDSPSYLQHLFGVPFCWHSLLSYIRLTLATDTLGPLGSNPKPRLLGPFDTYGNSQCWQLVECDRRNCNVYFTPIMKYVWYSYRSINSWESWMLLVSHIKQCLEVRFEVFVAVVLRIPIFWHEKMCRWVSVSSTPIRSRNIMYSSSSRTPSTLHNEGCFPWNRCEAPTTQRHIP